MLRRAFATLRWVFHAGNGRPAALALLLGLLIVLQFPEQSPFKIARVALFDRYQQTLPRERISAPVTIVDIDEASLKQHGQWPWPRDVTAALIRHITALEPAAVGIDIYFPEADQTSPPRLAQRLGPEQEATRRVLAALPDHDLLLAEAIGSGPVVLGAAGFERATQTTATGMRVLPVRSTGGAALPHVRHYPFVLASLPQLQARASGQALLSVDLQGAVVRQIPLVQALGDTLVPSLAMEMLRVATGAPAITAEVGDEVGGGLGARGVSAVSVADLRVPTQPDGTVWLHFGRADASRYVSAATVLAGQVDPERIRNKLVLVGLSGFGLVDMRLTPLGEQVPGVDIQAQLLENLFDGTTLRRPRWMGWIETVLVAVGGLFVIWAVPVLRARLATLLATLFMAALFGAGFATFHFFGLLLDAATVFGAINIVFGSMLGSAFIEADRQRRSAQAALQRERESAAAVAGELAAARRIQLGSLPDPDVLFAGETRFAIAALLEPAREVGGDLYDFYLIDRNRLFFVVGDVSGKGVPASLFMAVTKTLGRSLALRAQAGPGAVLTDMNRELARDNPELLFVTLLAGFLDCTTGQLELCSAGHDAPRLLHARSQGVALLEDAGGPPLCMLPDFDYPTLRTQLAPGDTLVIVTDGITEAMNRDQDAFGTARLDALLGALPRPASAAAVRQALRQAVADHVAGAEASDDLTLLVLQWQGVTPATTLPGR